MGEIKSLVLTNNQLTKQSLPLLIDFIKNDNRLKRINIQGNMFADQELVQKLIKECKSKAIQLKVDLSKITHALTIKMI